MESLHSKTNSELIEKIEILQSRLQEVEKDNSELLSARASLGESEKNFRLAMEATSDGFWDWKVQTGEVYYSPSWEKILGEKKLDPIYESWESRIHPEDKTAVLKSLNDHLDNRSDYWQCEHRLLTSSNEWKRVLGTGRVVMRDDDDKPLLMVGTMTHIFKLSKIERDFQMSDVRSKIILQAIPDLMFQISADGVHLDFHASDQSQLFVHPEEFLGKRCDEVLPADVAEKYLSNINKTIETSQMQIFEYQLDFKGEQRHYEARMVKSGDNETLTIVRDISERKKIEQNLLMKEYLLTAAQRVAGIGSYELDFKSGNWKSSIGLDNIFGIDENFGRDINAWGKILHPDDREEMISYLQNDVMTAHKNFNKEYRIIRIIDGEKRWVHGLGELEFDANGKLVKMIGTIQDITRRKKNEDELRKLSHSVEQSPAVVMITDTHGKIEYVNKRFTELTGYMAEEAIGRNPRMLKSGEHTDEEYKNLWDTILSGGEWRGVFYNRKKSGELYWESATISSVKDKHNVTTHFVAIKEDITEQKIAEEKLRQNQKRLDLIYNSTSDQMALVKVEDNGVYRLISFNNAYWQKIQVLNPKVKKEQILGIQIDKMTRLFNWPVSLIDNLICTYEKVINQRKEVNVQEVLPSEQGKIILESHYSPIYDENNICTHIMFTSHDITDKIQAEGVLRESEEKFRTIFNESPIGIELYNADGIQLTANNASIKMFGILDKTDILTFNLFDGVSLDADKIEKLRKGVPVTYHSTYDFEKVKELQIYKTRRSGKSYFDYIITPLLNGEKKTIQGYLLQVQDITKRKLAEKELQEKEKRYRTLFDLSPSGIILLDTDGIIIDVNESFCKSVLYTRDELIGENIRILAPAQNHREVGEHILKILSGNIFEHVVKNIKKDGTICDMELQESLVLLPDGRNGIISVANDISERLHAEEVLRESEEKFRNLANYSPNMIFINRRGKIVYVNKLTTEITGYNRDELYSVSFDFKDLIEPEYLELIVSNFNQHMKGEEVPPAEYAVRTKTGERIDVVINTKLINYEGEMAVLGIVTDITEQKRAEDALMESYTQLRSLTERLQVIREEERALVAREIHDDLGQSLTALKMDVSWLQKNPGMDETERVEKFDMIMNLTNSTIQTVKKIASDLRPGVLDDLGLIPAIEWQTYDFESRYRIKCILTVNQKDIVIGDHISIAVFRIFQETLTNIARHSKATRVDIKIDFKGNRKLIMEIQDNGIGIDNEKARGQKSFGLLGMKERANVLKGSVEIIGKPSAGTLIRVVIPY